MTSSRALRRIVLALFFLSGISGLVYQIAWTRLLVLVFGNTVLATSTVLSAFMAGLALGSVTFGELVDRRPWNRLRLYALLEVGIGLSALAFPWLLSLFDPLYTALYLRFGEHLVLINLVRFAIAFALIAVPTFFMGATLPVLIKELASALGRLGVQVGALYGLNTAGAVVGCVVAGYWMLGRLGLELTVASAAALNFAVAVAAWIVARSRGEAEEWPAAADEAEMGAPAVIYPRPIVIAVTVAIGVSGFCALAYEVLWARMLNLFLLNNVFSVTATIATFLLGIALGSLVYSRWLARWRSPVGLFAAVEIGIGLAAWATPYVFSGLLEALFARRAEAWTIAKTAAIMLPPTVLMGIAVPLAVQIAQLGRGREGGSVGRVYAWNTVGSILGAFAAGFLLIPALGLHEALVGVAALNLLAGAAVLIAQRAGVVRRVVAVATVGVLALLAATLPDGLFRELYRRATPNSRILHYKEGHVANVVVYDFDAGYKDLHLNGVEEASSRLWHVQLFKLLGVLPMVVHDDPGEALMIAFGAGMSAGATAVLADHLEVVDLNPDIGGPAEAFRRENLGVLDRPNVTVTVNDGRNELHLDPKRYSVIISDATNPKMFDSWTLYTKEFYELTKRRLLPGGVFAQWMVYPLPGDSLRAILSTFRSVYPHASYWCIHGSSQCLMLGTPERLAIDVPQLEERLLPALERTRFDEYGVRDVAKLLSFLVLGEDEMAAYLEGYDRVSVDDLPHPQFILGRGAEGVRECLDLIPSQRTAWRYVTDPGPDPYGLRAALEAHLEVAIRLNLGFYLGRVDEHERALWLARRAGLSDPRSVDDANVATALRYDAERLLHFRTRLAAEPDDPKILNGLGYVLWRRGELDEARRTLERALEIEPEFAAARANLALVLLDAGKLDEAEEMLGEIERRSPTPRMLALVEAGLHRAVVDRRARYEVPGFELRFEEAVARLRLGDLAGAAEVAEVAGGLAEDPRESLRVAELFQSMDLIADAAPWFARAARGLPSDPRVAAAARASDEFASNPTVRQTRLRDTRTELVAAATGDDPHPAACREASARWSGRDFLGGIDPESLRAAAEGFEAAIREDPAHLHAYLDAARLRELLQEPAMARDLLARAAELAGAGAVPAAELQRLEHLAAGASDALAPEERAGHLVLAARLEARRGRPDRATALAERALALAPSSGDAEEALIAAHVVAGRYPEAEQLLRAALEAAVEPARRAELERRLAGVHARAPALVEAGSIP